MNQSEKVLIGCVLVLFTLIIIHLVAEYIQNKKVTKKAKESINKKSDSISKVLFYKDRFGHLKGEIPYFQK